MRLNKFIAQSGYCSRRKADDLIFTGRVTVNNTIIKNPAVSVIPDNDIVLIDKKSIKIKTNYVYFILNKPLRTITSASDDRNRKTVIDILNRDERVYPVGRLDYMTSGVLLISNDGDLTQKLSHPSSEIKKVYAVTANRRLSIDEINKLEDGVLIDGKKTSKAKIYDHKQNHFVIEIHEGRNRQIRKMLEAIQANVVKLDRIEYAGLNYDGLKQGEFRALTENELIALRNL